MLAAHAPTRHKLDKGYLGSFGVDVGRASSVYHLSVFEDYDERDAREATEGLRFFHQGVQSLESSVFKEASATLNEAGLPGLQDGLDAVQGCAFELRTYELQLGYDTVPNFLEIYSGGLKDKMEHDDSGESRLISLLHSEAGVAPLNTVIELWRHESAQGAQRSRLASRKATSWRRARGCCQVCSTSSSMRSAVVPSLTSVNSGLHVRSIASSSTCREGRRAG